MPNLCRDSQIKTLPKIADVLTQLLQVICHQIELKIDIETKTERRPRGNLCDREFSHDLDTEGHQGCHHRHLQPGDLTSTFSCISLKHKTANHFCHVQVHTGEEIVRERALRLVHTKLKTNTTDLLNREAQAQVVIVLSMVSNNGISLSVDC